MRSIKRPRPETVHAASVMTRAAQERLLLPILLFLLLSCLSILPAHATTEATNTPSSSPAASQPPLQPPPNANAGTAADGTHQAPPSDSTPSERRRLLFVATHNVPRGKFHHLEQLAAIWTASPRRVAPKSFAAMTPCSSNHRWSRTCVPTWAAR